MVRIFVAVTATAFTMSCALADKVSEITSFAGMCDASAALALNETTFVVANDEDNSLRVYERGKSDAKPFAFDLSSFLEITKKSKKTGKLREADIEGATRIGNRTYWIGSHGRNSDGEERKERHRLFAIDITMANGSVKFDVVGKPYKDLLVDLLKADDLKKYALDTASQNSPESEHGLNIEGLAASGGTLLIAFRNPRPGGKALIVPLEKPADVLSDTPKASFGEAIELDLQKRGIRSIEFVESRKAFVIVAGAHDDNKNFALYEWSGPPTTKVTLLAGIDFKDLTPEAQFSLGNQLYFLSDDGGVKIGDKDCKDLFAEPQKQIFRGFTLSP